jgi:hypothetical protein
MLSSQSTQAPDEMRDSVDDFLQSLLDENELMARISSGRGFKVMGSSLDFDRSTKNFETSNHGLGDMGRFDSLAFLADFQSSENEKSLDLDCKGEEDLSDAWKSTSFLQGLDMALESSDQGGRNASHDTAEPVRTIRYVPAHPPKVYYAFWWERIASKYCEAKRKSRHLPL